MEPARTIKQEQARREIARRKAQSAKDKALARANQGGQGMPKPRKLKITSKSGKANLGPRPGKQVSAAAAYSTGQASSAPMIQASRDSARIVHRELIASVVGSGAFTVQKSFSLNPGLAATFPWLSTQAQSWEAYRFNKLKFCAYTRTGSATPGSLMLVPDYDAADAAPATETIASSYEDVEEDVPWKDIECTLRPGSMHALGPRKFIRLGALPANQDVKTYDAGTLFVCTVDGSAVNWSKLWVEYDVTLFTPQLPPSGAGVLASDHRVGTLNVTANNFANPVVQAGSTPLFTIAGNVLTFVTAGEFLITDYQSAGVSTTFADSPTLGAGAALVVTYQGVGYSPGGVTNLVSALITSPVGGTFSWPCTIVTGTVWDLFVASVPVTQT